MNKETTFQKILDQHLWKIFDQFRGLLSAESAFSLLLQLLFYKFLEDNREDIEIEQKSHQLNFPEQYRFSNLMLSKESELSETLSKALLAVEQINDPLLLGIFMQSDLSYFDRSYDRQAGRVLLELISVINTLNFNSKYLSKEGTAFSAIFSGLIDKHAETELRRSIGFMIPKSLRELLAGLSQISSKPDETIYDPACGTGALLMDVVQYAKSSSNNLTTAFAQERNMTILSLAKMQWIINGQDPNKVAIGDALSHPQFTQNGNLQQFDTVISCPPFGMSGWGADLAASDRYHRFSWGIPPANKADYAYILHTLASLKPKGAAFLVSTAGVLFRGGTEEQIRKKMIDNNVISAIISLPAGLFNLWNIPLCILCLNNVDKTLTKGLLMIDLSSYPDQVRDKEGLNTSTINAIVESVKVFFDSQQVATQYKAFSKIVTKEEIAANDYNLNIARYFVASEKAPVVDTLMLSNEIIQLENELHTLDLKIKQLKRQLKIF
ncbi:N-6 DNA methylase [Mucilaginibacter angelicae]|uniref:site-specific DNA-methyltransferase (adenine-specific) n=1 Tax=Mucilaginibacter angelicae TaxID=869718 RepID=A0ABV6L7C6_9SPHI